MISAKTAGGTRLATERRETKEYLYEENSGDGDGRVGWIVVRRWTGGGLWDAKHAIERR